MSGSTFFKSSLPDLAPAQSHTLNLTDFVSNNGDRFNPIAKAASHLLIRLPEHSALTFKL
jgi:hypothetical protein